MKKKCSCCKKEKSLFEFFSASFGSRSAEVGTSMFCKQCHTEGKIKYGYGWFGDMYREP